MLTQEQLKSELSYNPDTGNFTWLINRRGGAKAGDIAGTVDATPQRKDVEAE